MKRYAALLIAAGMILIGSMLWSETQKSDPVDQGQVVEETFAIEEESQAEKTKSIFDWKDASKDDLLDKWDTPDRKDPSGYGYDWWIYEDKLTQVGIQSGEIVTAVAFVGDEEDVPVHIGQTYQEISQNHDLPRTVRVENVGNYTFELTERDLYERPLLPIDKDWTAQLYFDVVTEKLSAIRLVRNDILLKLQPYKVIYRGKLPIEENLGRSEWKKIETGMEKQILLMTNHFRSRYNLEALESHNEAATVAFLHSKDMNDNNYFSHYSPNGDGLKERLGDISFVQAGENIAAQYIDATAAVHGWLNSEDHREALLDPSYTHIGIGVHQRYYTQNFLSIP